MWSENIRLSFYFYQSPKVFQYYLLSNQQLQFHVEYKSNSKVSEKSQLVYAGWVWWWCEAEGGADGAELKIIIAPVQQWQTCGGFKTTKQVKVLQRLGSTQSSRQLSHNRVIKTATKQLRFSEVVLDAEDPHALLLPRSDSLCIYCAYVNCSCASMLMGL